MSLVIKNVNDWNTLMKSDLTYVVDFMATWCGPCRAIGPFFEEQAVLPKYANLAFLKVDVDKVHEVAAVAGVSAMPTFQVWHKGSIASQFVGANKADLTTFLDKALEIQNISRISVE